MLTKYYSEKMSDSVYESDMKVDVNLNNLLKYTIKCLFYQIPQIIEKFKLAHFKQSNLEKNFKCLHCCKKVNLSEIYKLKYNDVIRGWNLDHFNTTSSNLANEKTLFSNNSHENPAKNQNEYENEQIYYTKTNKLKKNISQIYRNIFNENQREENFNNTIKNQNVISYYDEYEGGGNRPDGNLIDVNKNYNIPIIISRLHPTLKEKEYFSLSKNPGFLNKNALVCESCYLEIIAHSHANQNLKQIFIKHQKDKEIFGTGKLDPQSTAYRFKVRLKLIILKLFSIFF